MCVFVYIFLKEISMRKLIIGFSTCQLRHILFIFKKEHVSCYLFKLLQIKRTNKNIFNYEKWKGYMLSKLSLLSPHQNHLWP